MWEGLVGSGGGRVWGSQGGCKRTSEVFVKIIVVVFLGGYGGGRGSDQVLG